MQHVLIVWELGGNLGHLSQLHLVARTVAAKGARVTFAVRDYEAAAPWLRARGWNCVTAPRTRISFWGRRLSAGHADWYLCEGFGSPVTVQGLIRGWSELIDRLLPDRGLHDFAPAAIDVWLNLETAVDRLQTSGKPHGY